MIKELDRLFSEIQRMNAKPANVKGLSNEEKIKVLTKQMKQVLTEYVLKDKDLNQFKDVKVKGIKIRFQKVYEYPPSLLRNLIDQGKKDIVSGLIVSYAIEQNDDGKINKIGVAVGVTKDLTKKFNAIDLVKEASVITGGKGGGGRPDFAQAGATDENKIEDAFEKIKSLI